MTEDEAKKKICPTMSVTDYDHCQGSACMAWRERREPAHQENYHGERPAGDDWKPGAPKMSKPWWWRTIPERVTGYCGLAGAPAE